MSNKNILYVCQEISPYVSDSPTALAARYLAQDMQERGMSVRTFMPCFGSINERRNQLHEVKRFYGMNLIVNNSDYQLIIKVASIPVSRVQIYFIDNEDFFKRKYVLKDENGEFFADNDERAMFFARGVLETVKKLRWMPDVVHCHGWFSAIVPAYIREVFAEDPLFTRTKIVVSLYDDEFPGQFNAELDAKLAGDGIGRESLAVLEKPDYASLMKFALSYADGVIYCTDKVPEQVRKFVAGRKIPVLEYTGNEERGVDYVELYDKITG